MLTHMTGDTCHVSPLTCNLSPVICHLPCLFFFLSFVSYDYSYVKPSKGLLPWGAGWHNGQQTNNTLTLEPIEWIGLGAESVKIYILFKYIDNLLISPPPLIWFFKNQNIKYFTSCLLNSWILEVTCYYSIRRTSLHWPFLHYVTPALEKPFDPNKIPKVLHTIIMSSKRSCCHVRSCQPFHHQEPKNNFGETFLLNGG